MDRETANRLADELISQEQAGKGDTPQITTISHRSIGLGHFFLPVILSSIFTWLATSAEASGMLAIAIGSSVGIIASHIIHKYVL